MIPDTFRIVGHRKMPVCAGDMERRIAVISRGGVGVVIILKCASRSMFAGEGFRSIVGRDKMPSELHVFVRDPIKRLVSAYQFFRRRPPVSGYPDLKQITWEQFIDAVLNNEKNPHWCPVSETLSYIEQDVIAHKFENLSSEYPLGSLGHKNPSNPVAVDEGYRANEILALYAGDVSLREAA